MLETESLVKAYRKRTVVSGVSLRVGPGEVVGLLGPNGAGKTTTFSMAVGLVQPDAGRVRFLGNDVTKLPMYRRAQAGMAYLPQEASVFRQLTVRQNLLAVLEFQRLTKAEREARADKLLDELAIAHLAGSKAEILSGGERRRTEIARALAIEPKVFLLDEPFAGIDPIAVADLQDTVQQLAKRGIGVLITDHNVRETLHIADRAYIVAEGKVLAEGNPESIAQNPQVREIYLGERFYMEHGTTAPTAPVGDGNKKKRKR
ncbi:MAG: LPS export ABC transporter ATP-binding protein [Candidatus Hydrogenedens sp.]|nr:LPS export ABC transporter ATP-binding protein [Candidatus Hydrogenedens sp.]